MEPLSLNALLASSPQLCVKIFQDRGHQVDFLKTMPEEELIKVIGDYDGLVVRSATKVTPEVMKHATKLRIVGRAGVGVDNINVKEATKYGIMVMNTPEGNTVSTAQLTLSLLCSLARHIPAANMSVKAGKWDRKSYMGVEIAGKTLGIIGCGRIGQVVASSAKTMDMQVIGYDPVMSREQMEAAGIAAAPLDKIWQDSDFITVHTPLTPETANIINDETLAKCRAGVRIVNCARGGIVDEAALLRGLESGRVAGAALDVYTSEPPKEHLAPLVAHPNLICTPHLGASTEEAQVNVARDIAVQMCDVFEGKDYVGIVNVSYMAAATQIPMKPFMELSETLGAIVSQMSEAKVRAVEISTWGGRDVKIDTKQARDLLLAKVRIHVHTMIICVQT
jgi:D-3-phosphoglycerate dehydrogenase